MKIFKPQELKGLLLVFVFLGVATYFGVRSSNIRERDVQRNLDVSAIAGGINKYHKDYITYPLSSEAGKIIACRGEETKIVKDKSGEAEYRKGATKPILEGLVECEWAQDSLLDINDTNYPHYLGLIPKDPLAQKGTSYLYVSDGNGFWIYGAFEGKTQKEYDEAIKDMGLICGSKICNFGKGSTKTPLEKVGS